MDKYYYLVSQLPFLKFTEKPYISRENFLSESQKWLLPWHFEVILGVDLNDFWEKPSDPQALKSYKNFELNLRKVLALIRAARKEGRSGESLNWPDFPSLDGSPLEVEKKLLFFRWKFIEEKEQGHHFDLVFLIYYFLKLQISERLFTFNKEKGTACFDELCEVNPLRDGISSGGISNGVKL